MREYFYSEEDKEQDLALLRLEYPHLTEQEIIKLLPEVSIQGLRSVADPAFLPEDAMEAEYYSREEYSEELMEIATIKAEEEFGKMWVFALQEGLSLREISRRTGISRPKVKKKLEQVTDYLLQLLKDKS